MFNTKKRSRGSIASVFVLLVSLGIALFLVLNRQHIIDQISVWQYRPSNDIVAIATRSGLNENGTFVFYAAHPSIEDASSFNQKCGRKESSTAILGCYNGQDIYIYNVTDARLDGIREVTAAHEMLHAAYARLSDGDKNTINKLLTSEYEKLKDNKDFAERMAFYDRTEPGERDNELHSIIGTEVGSIGNELEAYYKRYFSDRNKVVVLHEKYAAVFGDLQKRGESISSQLTALGTAIEQQSSQYNADVAQLNRDIVNFNNKANNGGFSSDGEFQAARNGLVARANRLEATRQSINDSIQHYNELRDELAAVASESDALNKSIDSSLAPAPSL
ncbi:MAG TPA: hypothetical protein VFH06_05690 [Candidatus Saccharimonadales bacterium]|nr:hypothetical protein [Candidatus Saccharimonadales bacterium]